VSDAQAQVEALRTHGWRQGSVLPATVTAAARTQNDGRWPSYIPAISDDDWLIVVSHPCDVRNRGPQNEPAIEVVVARPFSAKKSDSRATFGKNSRTLHFEGLLAGARVKLVANAHERFTVDRFLLALAAPHVDRQIEPRALEVLIGWIAKRYRRQAFPDEFDQAVSAAKAKTKVDIFLTTHAKDLLAVFVAFADRPESSPRFHAAFRLVVKRGAVREDWATQQSSLEVAFDECWSGVEGVAVDVVAIQADHFSLGEMAEGGFQKFDRDWISYEYDSESAPVPG
jgi:hypothetical protein